METFQSQKKSWGFPEGYFSDGGGLIRIDAPNTSELNIRIPSDVYIAVLYFDACIFQEEKGKASFQIDKESISKKLQEKIRKNESKLQDSVEFDNGMKKGNPWNNIMNFNRYYEKKYGICII